MRALWSCKTDALVMWPRSLDVSSSSLTEVHSRGYGSLSDSLSDPRQGQCTQAPCCVCVCVCGGMSALHFTLRRQTITKKLQSETLGSTQSTVEESAVDKTDLQP